LEALGVPPKKLKSLQNKSPWIANQKKEKMEHYKIEKSKTD